MAKKLLLDTDIGSSIDDAVCLAYLLAQSECELLGITTVSGDTVQRAMLASVMCKAAGKDIPIFPGAAVPLLVISQQPDVPRRLPCKSGNTILAFHAARRLTSSAKPFALILAKSPY